MSALAGLWWFDGRPQAASDSSRMLAAQAVYGPHDSSLWDGGDVALGRRLFRVLPEDKFDRQPLKAGGSQIMVGDVRIDNRDALSRELRISTGLASEMSDADFLLAAWERWQEDCFDHLVGDYAFALWDPDARRLVLARDPMGQRPMHYHEGAGFVAFASMPKGLQVLAEVGRRPDPGRIQEFLTLMPEEGPRSFFAGISRVEPGHLVILSERTAQVRLHWRPRRRSLGLNSAADYAEGLRTHLDEAVRSCLRGPEGAVGAHLSGGWDSSSVAATAARLLAPSDGRITAFTAVPRPGYVGVARRNRYDDEGPMAALTAALYPNMDHVILPSSGRSPLQDLDKGFNLYDRPVLNLCNGVWLHDLNTAAKGRGVKVMLTGTMGNYGMSYAGTDWLPELVSRGQGLGWLREARAVARNSGMRWRGIMMLSFGSWLPGALWNALYRLRGDHGYDATQYSMIAPALWRSRQRDWKLGGHDFQYRPKRDVFRSRVAALRRSDLGNYYKGMIGGWGVDYRDPTADRRLIEFCLSVPMEQILLDGRPRSLARRALADRLPAEVLADRQSGAHGADWHEALTNDRAGVALEIDRCASFDLTAELLNIPRMRALLDQWPTSGWETDATVQNYRSALLRGLSVGHFLRKASGSNQ